MVKDSGINNKEQVEKWLLSNQSVVVFVNTRHDSLEVPSSQKHKPSLSLSLSHFFQHPIKLKEDFIEAELSFDGASFKCVIPWESVWAAYPEDLPGLIFLWNENSPGPGWDKALLDYLKIDPIIEQKAVSKPKLSLVQDSQADSDVHKAPDSAEPSDKTEKKSAKKGKPALKLIK